MTVAPAIMLAAIAAAANVTTVPGNTTTPTTPQDRTSKSSTELIGVDPDGPAGLCRLRTTDPFVHNKVHQLLTVEKATLINYQLDFANYTRNPLTISMAGVYDARKWSRVTTAHGQTLLSLAFNYGVLSMMTLTLGTVTLDIQLQDSPFGCFAKADNQQKVTLERFS